MKPVDHLEREKTHEMPHGNGPLEQAGIDPRDVPKWIPVGHDLEEHDLPPLVSLVGSMIHWDDEKTRTKQELGDEALSDAPSFVEVGHSATHAITHGTAAPIGENIFAYISASAAIYLISQIHLEGRKQGEKLDSVVSLFREYVKSGNPKVLHKAGLEMEQIPKAQMNAETRARTMSLANVNAAGEDVAGTDKLTARAIAQKLVTTGHAIRHSVTQTLKNAYWNNPRRIGEIFSSVRDATSRSMKLAQLSVLGKHEIHEEDFEVPEGVHEDEEIDLSSVYIDDIESRVGTEFDPKVLEESLHIDEDYLQALDDRKKFMRLTVIQAIFVGAAATQGVVNALKGDGGWAIVNFSSASAASGPLKYFADMMIANDELLKTRRAQTGHLIAQLAGRERTREFSRHLRNHEETNDDEGHFFDVEMDDGISDYPDP